MKVLVTGVGGQLGHDVMNELAARGYEGTGSDLAPAYAGIPDGSAVTSMPYVSLDITDREAVLRTVGEIAPDVICVFFLMPPGGPQRPVSVRVVVKNNIPVRGA